MYLVIILCRCIEIISHTSLTSENIIRFNNYNAGIIGIRTHRFGTEAEVINDFYHRIYTKLLYDISKWLMVVRWWVHRIYRSVISPNHEFTFQKFDELIRMHTKQNEKKGGQILYPRSGLFPPPCRKSFDIRVMIINETRAFLATTRNFTLNKK